MTVEEYNKSVDQCADGVFRFILKNIRDEDKARDIVQDAFEKMWRRAGHVEYQKAKSYLFTTAYHTMIDFIRQDSHMVGLEIEDTPDPDFHENSYSDLGEILNEALGRLPEIQRSVVMLRDYEGYSYREIGDITRLNESQVKVYIYRARMFLKNYIGKLENVL